MPAHHDAAFTGRPASGVRPSRVPGHEGREPALITVSKQYREPVCFNTEVNIQRSR
jgi:hypothetical protein